MYSVKIKNNNLQNLFSVLDNTVPGSSPFAVNKTISSDTSFCVNTTQTATPVSVSLIQGSTPERFTVGTTVTGGNYRYLWLFKTSSSSNSVSTQVGNISFGNGSIIFSLPSNLFTTGYVSYNHPDSSVYSGFLRIYDGLSVVEIIPIAVTVYDANTITTANEFTCTQMGIVYVSYSKFGSGTNAVCGDLEIFVGQKLSSVVSDLINAFDNTSYSSTFQNLTEITNVSSGTTGNMASKFITVYSTAIFSIN